MVAAVVYVGFFGAIAVACYVTKSAWPLLFLLAMPSYHGEKD